ncbi:MAG: MFS transporter, partial [Desulfobacteraceae bacterium]
MNIFRESIPRTIILTVCAGIMPQLFFKNGFLLSYFLTMGLESSDVLIILSLPSLFMLFLSVPFAYFADRHGIKRIGVLGIFLTVSGFLLLILAAFFNSPAASHFILSGIILFSIGVSSLLSGWFGLLSPLVPEAERGKFFGTLRVTWQVYAIGCSYAITRILEQNTTLTTYQFLLLFFTILLICQVFLYLKIPEVEKNRTRGESMRNILAKVPDIQGYMPFCAYCFLLMLATGSWPVTLGLLEKNVLSFSDDAIVHMGTMLFLGSILGFYAGGRLVDRFGTKIVFLVVHFSYFVFLFLVILRGLVSFPMTTYFSILTFCLGLVQAASSIALTSEMMALTPPSNRSVITSIC